MVRSYIEVLLIKSIGQQINEAVTENPRVGSSILSLGTINRKGYQAMA